MQDRRDERDGRGFEVRSSRCSELRTLNVTRWLMPDTMLLPISPDPPFPLVAHRPHVSSFVRHGLALADFFSILIRWRIVSRVGKRLLVRCFSTRGTGILGSSRKRNLAKDGIPVPGHKPIEQIAEGLNQCEAQED